MFHFEADLYNYTFKINNCFQILLNKKKISYRRRKAFDKNLRFGTPSTTRNAQSPLFCLHQYTISYAQIRKSLNHPSGNKQHLHIHDMTTYIHICKGSSSVRFYQTGYDSKYPRNWGFFNRLTKKKREISTQSTISSPH